MKGIIKWYDPRKGYGFIQGAGDFFVHRSSVPAELDLQTGDKVEFETEETNRGSESSTPCEVVTRLIRDCRKCVSATNR